MGEKGFALVRWGTWLALGLRSNQAAPLNLRRGWTEYQILLVEADNIVLKVR